jgi:hypothetical protein
MNPLNLEDPDFLSLKYLGERRIAGGHPGFRGLPGWDQSVGTALAVKNDRALGPGSSGNDDEQKAADERFLQALCLQRFRSAFAPSLRAIEGGELEKRIEALEARAG